MPSSQGELTVQLETRTLRQQSMSMPSRLVSILRLSMVRLSTPVARMPNHPPCRMEKSLRMTLRQFLSAMALLPTPGAVVLGSAFSLWPRLRPLPQIRPGAEDAEVVDVFAPDEAVVPVIVAVVLIGLPRALRLGGIVSAAGKAVVGSGRGEDGRALLEGRARRCS